MYNRLQAFFLFVLSLTLLHPLAAQDKERLRLALENLRTADEDTNKVKWLNDIAWDTSYNNLVAGRQYAQQALELAQNLHYNLGIIRVQNTLGTICLDMGDLNGALKAHLASLRLADSLGNKRAMGTSYLNMASVYQVQNKTAKVLECQQKALSYYREIDYRKGLNVILNNIGNTYAQLDSTEKAEPILKEALAMAREAKSNNNITAALSGLALCAANRKDANKAIQLMEEAIKISDSINSKYEKAQYTLTYANILAKLKQYDRSETLLMSARTAYDELGMPQKIQEVYNTLAAIYEQKGNWQLALEYTKRSSALKDSLFNERILNTQRDMELLYESEKKDRDILLLKHQQTSQKVYLWAAIGGCLLLITLVFVLLNRNALRRKTNLALQEQKAIIEEKNKSITDSINYALRIQSAMWPRPSDFEKYLKQGFVMLLPKDIVSGDFYWLSEKDDYIFIATVDCTGHGVPGGFMSMLGSLLLTEIISEKGIIEPAAILDMLRDKVISALRQTGAQDETKDGMDMVLCRYKKETREITYAAANNSFYVIHEQQLTEYSPDKQPVGYYTAMRPFTQKSFVLPPDAIVVTYTDGYADQFGGTDGKKFKYKQFKDVLVSNAHLPINEQEVKLAKTFNTWKGNLEQVDDVLVMAFRFL